LIHEGVPSAELAQLRAAETVAAARAAYGIGPDELLGVTLASLHERKGLDVLIDALAEIKLPEGRRLRWLIGGQGPLLEALREHAQRRARPDCELQLLGQTDARQLLAAGELFALPSRLEGLGVALLEAMASGLPAVASRVGGMQDSMVDGETGHFAEPGDVKSLRAALQRLVSDGEARQRMGAAARDRAAAKFDVEAMCRATERVYLECAALRPKNDA
jgi:glycosyltransferase involved in cell wall biosynthesis